MPVQVGRLEAATVGATPVDPAGLPDQSASVRVVLVQDDGAGVFVAVPWVPLQRHQPVPPVYIVEE